jgi:hypothetical protein
MHALAQCIIAAIFCNGDQTIDPLDIADMLG